MSGGNDLIFRIVQSARLVHGSLGPGFLEIVYVRALLGELRSRGFRVEREKLVKIRYGLQVVGRHRLDLVVENSVVVELKAGRGIAVIHKAQVRSYLHATKFPFGLILNFGMPELEWESISSEETQR